MIAEAVLFTIFFCFPVLLLASSGKKEPCMGTGLVLPALAAGALLLLLLLPPPVDAVGAPEGTRPFHHSGDAAKYEKHFFATTTDKKVTNNLFHCSDGIMIRRKKNSDKGSKNKKEWCAQMDDFKFECNYAEAESAGAKADETYLIGSSKNFDEEGKPLQFRHFLDLLGEKKTLRCPIVGDETERLDATYVGAVVAGDETEYWKVSGHFAKVILAAPQQSNKRLKLSIDTTFLKAIPKTFLQLTGNRAEDSYLVSTHGFLFFYMQMQKRYEGIVKQHDGRHRFILNVDQFHIYRTLLVRVFPSTEYPRSTLAGGDPLRSFAAVMDKAILHVEEAPSLSDYDAAIGDDYDDDNEDDQVVSQRSLSKCLSLFYMSKLSSARAAGRGRGASRCDGS